MRRVPVQRHRHVQPELVHRRRALRLRSTGCPRPRHPTSDSSWNEWRARPNHVLRSTTNLLPPRVTRRHRRRMDETRIIVERFVAAVDAIAAGRAAPATLDVVVTADCRAHVPGLGRLDREGFKEVVAAGAAQDARGRWRRELAGDVAPRERRRRDGRCDSYVRRFRGRMLIPPRRGQRSRRP